MKPMNEILKELRRPFHSSKVKFKVASNTRGDSAICVGYVDARDVQERFNEVCEGFWSNTYREIYEDDFIDPEGAVTGKRLKAVEATILIKVHKSDPSKVGSHWEEISHSDIGSMDNVNDDESFGYKAVYSDAFKRAAVPFGVAAPLYAMPQLWLEKNEVHFKMNGNKPGYMKPTGEDLLRKKYIEFLRDEGVAKYGEPF